MNPYVIGVTILIVIGVVWKTYHMGYTAGANDVTVVFAEANAAAVKEEKQDVKEIIKWKEKRVVVYRDRIKEVKIAQDPTGCLDMPLTDVGLDRLLSRPGDSETGPSADHTSGGLSAD